MRIRWFGQSAFLLTSRDGTRLAIDPCGKFLGYRMPAVEADIVAVTHDHRDHNRLDAISGRYKLANRPETYACGGFELRGVRTYHDKANGAKRGENIVFVIRADGLTVAHCGDLGHLLTAEQAEAIGPVDVLIVPVGGRMTLNGAEAAEVAKQLQATVLIPMHYRTKALGLLGKFIFEKVDRFVEAVGRGFRKEKELELTPDRLQAFAGVVELSYE
ncbi:MBL fold metallo-hydrolase [Cohnella zeiphila]|uniref:MBL fold metallo-hydrolase n=1 Tax=Cohnella zeiphila TaxID=2761120 RepID=A0A7X0VVG3_9BACL|nr:MBL fold metallo-hydrolase [Cohnella zeiphila]MBB6731380.1 MBL fold metallo-hydrolase [Cohnella zeiphila]